MSKSSGFFCGKIPSFSTTSLILGSMFFGVLFGLIIKQTFLPSAAVFQFFYELFDMGGLLFVRLMKMIVVPVVSVSIICGISGLDDFSSLGKIGVRTLCLYLITTAIAITIALFFAELFHIGHGLSLGKIAALEIRNAPSLKHTLVHIVPENPIAAMVKSQMLQIILFAGLVGGAVLRLSEGAKPFKDFILSLNSVLMSLVTIVMKFVPIGVFCLLGKLVLRTGFSAILGLSHYFFTVIFVLGCQLLFVYCVFLWSVGLSPLTFFRKLLPAMLFAFSVSSSNASIPVVLRRVRDYLGVHNEVASFVVPLGATLNMDGTAIMQGVATVFIANAFHVHLGLGAFLSIIGMATVASIGTAGVPGVGLITLAMVLQQVGVPVEGIGLIIGVDRILDMLRTAVNISGDSMIACVVGQTSDQLDKAVFSQ